MSDEPLKDQLRRVAQMAEDDEGETWDLSKNDRIALTSVVHILKMLGYYDHSEVCSMQHEWFCVSWCPTKSQTADPRDSQ